MKAKIRKNVNVAASLIFKASNLLLEYNEELSNALLVTCSELVKQLDHSPLVNEDEINELVEDIKNV